MHLKEVEMENFKSFGHKVRVPFLPGYTAVTGPNGSGKSNIGDAVLFVLGPKSSKAIRAGRLTDLIWNGGVEKRARAASYCEVSLVFDNTDRAMPVEADEVRLTRRVNVSASVEGGYNSYFYVNDKKASLNEFDQILANARISAEGYNMVQQGDVMRIVQMSNVERRRILDNVAGITKFDEDITSAEAKRRAAEDNIERIKLIIEEIGKQLKQLGADREGALKARELQEKLDTARAQLAVKNRQLAEETVANLEAQIAKFQQEKAKLETQRANLQKGLDEATTRLHSLESQIAERAGERGMELQEKLNDLKVKRATDQNTIENSQAEVKRLKTEEATVREEERKLQKDLAAVRGVRETALKAAREKGEELKRIEAEVQRIDQGSSGRDTKLGALQKEVAALTEHIAGLEERAKALVLDGEKQRLLIEQLEGEVEQLGDQRKNLAIELEDAEFQIKEITGGAKQAGKGARKVEEDLDARRKEEAELLRQARELEAAVITLTRDHERAKAQAEAAAYVEKGYGRAVMAILEARDKGAIGGIHGTVAEVLRVDGKLETAMSVAAGPRMQAVIVEDDAVAAKCIEHLKKAQTGRAAFLPLNKMLSQRPRGKALMVAKETLGFAIDLVKFDDKYRDALYYVFGDTLVVKDLNEARRLMGGIRLVTVEGELVEASGAMVGGHLDVPQVKLGPAKTEVAEVGERLRRAREQSEKLARRLAELREEIRRLEESLKEATGSSTVVEVKVATLEATRKDYATRVKTLDDDLEERGKRLQVAKAAAAKAARDLEKPQAELTAAKADLEGKRKVAMAASPQEVQQRYKDLLAQKSAVSEEFHAANAKGESTAASLKVSDERAAELATKLEGNEDARKAHEKAVKDLQAGLQRLENELRATQKLFDAMSRETADLQAQRDDAFQAKTRLEGEIEKVQGKVHAKDDFVLGIETRLAEERTALKEARRALEGMKAVDVERLPSIEALKQAIAEADAQLKALGPINMKALEAYEESTQRHAQIAQEMKDVDTQREELVKLVTELTERKKEGLGKVFTAIQENFRRVYGDLSGGGEAELLLENEANPFEGGLIMKARPPGKKVLRLEALSGGEKSLVSLAFIVALQEYDPSPFYLLDEVDQNLDAVNAEKVARMIKRNSSAAQFVQVSLRKITLKEADHLIGVTHVGGFSEVLMKVNLEDVQEEAPKAEVAT